MTGPDVGHAHLAAVSRDDPEVGGDAVSALHLHQVAHHHVLGVDVLLLAVADHQSLLKGGGGDKRTASTGSNMTQSEHSQFSSRRSKKT